MTDTLLREFEKWLKDEFSNPESYHEVLDDNYSLGIGVALKKLEELKKKYKVG